MKVVPALRALRRGRAFRASQGARTGTFALRRASGLLYEAFIPIGKPPEGGWPGIIFLHGGGFVRGSRFDIVDTAVRFWKTPAVCIVPDYRLAPEFTVAEMVEDVESAVQAFAGTGGDVDNIALVGVSAGGTLALTTALTSQKFQPKAVVTFGAMTDMEALGGRAEAFPQGAPAEASPARLPVRDDLETRFRLYHGAMDSSVPAEQAQLFKQAHPTADVRVISGADHTFSLPWARQYRDEGVRWAVHQIKKEGGQVLGLV